MPVHAALGRARARRDARAEVDRQARADDYDHAIRQIVSQAVSSSEVIDIFAAAGLQRSNVEILSDAFLAEVAGMEHRNLPVELLLRLLSDEIRKRSRRHLVQSRSFALLLALLGWLGGTLTL